MEEFKLILSLIGTILGLVITSITFLLKYMKSNKTKKAAQSMIDFSSVLLTFIEEAEENFHFTGKEKKNFVMTNAATYLMNHNMNVNTEKVSNQIEELIKLTKKVNRTSSDNSKELKKLYE